MYDFLIYPLLMPDAMEPSWFRLAYLGFNGFEAVAWLLIGLYVFLRFRKDLAGWLQLLAFWAFALSDVIECCGTTPLLLLFKGALLIALIQGKSRLRPKVGA